jgi:hypothetical protein
MTSEFPQIQACVIVCVQVKIFGSEAALPSKITCHSPLAICQLPFAAVSSLVYLAGLMSQSKICFAVIGFSDNRSLWVAFAAK